MEELPDVLKNPCNDCPWRRNAAPGWLGPHSAEEWFQMAHADVAIACHLTIPDGVDGEWGDEKLRQCAGVAIYRSNVCKSPRDPAILILPADTDRVFGFGEFVDHHTQYSNSK